MQMLMMFPIVACLLDGYGKKQGRLLYEEHTKQPDDTLNT